MLGLEATLDMSPCPHQTHTRGCLSPHQVGDHQTCPHFACAKSYIMPRKLIGMSEFYICDECLPLPMLISSFYRCNIGWPLAIDHIGAFVSSPLYQGRGVVQHTSYS
jgi:hypothetical protein